ncbi:FUSC family protein [Actinomadura gamaensis]|uniref:Aromatic acid exporter family protein n=1 Tax=Actinomadura gamaensis TaxID=1763541 RepID=A0ABV9TZR8_9ACTN
MGRSPQVWGRRLFDLGTLRFSAMVEGVWPVLQQTAAVSASWLIAARWAGHPQPVFAPIATAVALNARRGDRGTNAIRLLVGVAVGLLTAEASQWAWGAPKHLLAVLATAVFVSLMVARALTSQRIVMAQAAASAVIAVVTGAPHAGLNRMVDAAIGVAVALLVSQLLLPAEPLSTLRRVEQEAIGRLADTVRLVADAIDRSDETRTRRALAEMEEAVARLADLTDVRGSSTRAAKRSLQHRRRLAAVRREVRHAHRLQLLSLSCLSLVRTVLIPPAEDRPVAHAVPRRLQEVLTTLAALDGTAERRAAEQVLDLVRATAVATRRRPRTLDAIGATLRLTAVDVLIFAGRDQTDADRIVREAWERATAEPDEPGDAAPEG